MQKRKIDHYELDEYEQEIEANLESAISYSSEETKKKIDDLVEIAESHIAAKTKVSLAVHTRDLDALKYRASKLGIPYKTYINMVIHKHATSSKEEILV